MTIFDLFSKRRKKERGEIPDVYSYDALPANFRVQVVHILKDAFGYKEYAGDASISIVKDIYEILCREYGCFTLTQNDPAGSFEGLMNFLLKTEDLDKAIDVIEISFGIIERIIEKEDWKYNPAISSKDAIEELNGRFKENGIGYQYESGVVIRIDSQYVHAEAVKPALKLLNSEEFNNANDEFLSAHSHYRQKRYKECLNECLKCFESVLKIICTQKGWPYNQNDTAKKLISTVLDNGLLPRFFQSQLESGIPTIRNRLSGHGQGSDDREIKEFIASYTLNLTASTVLLLINAYEDS